ncbi:MAG: hypothetical protein AAF235_11455, partial [Planctomycetota bacterium]
MNRSKPAIFLVAVIAALSAFGISLVTGSGGVPNRPGEPRPRAVFRELRIHYAADEIKRLITLADQRLAETDPDTPLTDEQRMDILLMRGLAIQRAAELQSLAAQGQHAEVDLRGLLPEPPYDDLDTWNELEATVLSAEARSRSPQTPSQRSTDRQAFRF